MKYIILLTLLIVACTQATVPQETFNEQTTKNVITDHSWLKTELKDVNTGNTYTLDSFNKPVLVESFAVWCPTCTKQQEILKEMNDDDVVHVSIGIDPNENEQKIKEHAKRNGFDWYYSVAPVSFTQELIDEFGIGIVQAPSVPMILICEDKNFRKLSNGIKSVEELQSEIVKGCNV